MALLLAEQKIIHPFNGELIEQDHEARSAAIATFSTGVFKLLESNGTFLTAGNPPLHLVGERVIGRMLSIHMRIGAHMIDNRIYPTLSMRVQGLITEPTRIDTHRYELTNATDDLTVVRRIDDTNEYFTLEDDRRRNERDEAQTPDEFFNVFATHETLDAMACALGYNGLPVSETEIKRVLGIAGTLMATTPNGDLE